MKHCYFNVESKTIIRFPTFALNVADSNPSEFSLLDIQFLRL